MTAELSNRRQALADGALIGVAFVWGSTFVLVKDIVEQVPPMLFLAVRFAIASVALMLLLTALRGWRGLTPRELMWGSLAGLALGLGYTFQTIGLQYTTASNAGFITGMQVVAATLLGIFLAGQRPNKWSAAGVFLATCGLAMLSLNFERGVQINSGDPLVLGCAFAYGLQIVIIGRLARIYGIVRLTFIQLTVAGVVNALGALAFEDVRGVAWPPEVIAGAAFLGIVASALAFGVQVLVQRHTSVVHTALILTLEPVFAALFGYWLQGDRLGPIALSGAVSIVLGMVLAELGPYLLRQRAWRGLGN